MSFAAFADLITSFHPCGDQPDTYPRWRELIETFRPQARADSDWGEVRRREDLDLLPREVHLRVVVLDDDQGTVLRWVRGDSMAAAKVLGGYFHRHLDRGEGGGRSMCGWLRLDAHGEPDAR